MYANDNNCSYIANNDVTNLIVQNIGGMAAFKLNMIWREKHDKST